MFFQLLTGTIWQKSVNTAATKVLKSIKDISSAKSRNFTDISRGQLRAPTIQTSVKFCYLSLQSKISSIPLDFSPLNLVRFLILKRSFQSQNYNISVIYFGGSHLVVLNENYKRKEVRKFDKKCRLLNCQWPCVLVLLLTNTTHKLYWLFRMQEEDSRQVLVNLYKRKIYWKWNLPSSLKPA